MVNLNRLIGDVYLDLEKFGRKIYDMVDPGLKVSHERKRFYVEKNNSLANLIAATYILQGYLPVFNSEDSNNF
ncbi:hypothetical protein ES703_42088 [subsurface metagenome]